MTFIVSVDGVVKSSNVVECDSRAEGWEFILSIFDPFHD